MNLYALHHFTSLYTLLMFHWKYCLTTIYRIYKTQSRFCPPFPRPHPRSPEAPCGPHITLPMLPLQVVHKHNSYNMFKLWCHIMLRCLRTDFIAQAWNMFLSPFRRPQFMLQRLLTCLFTPKTQTFVCHVGSYWGDVLVMITLTLIIERLINHQRPCDSMSWP